MLESKKNSQLARRLATQLWGEVNWQKKFMEGAWCFSCSGHGGYIVDLDLHPQFAKFYSELTYKTKYMRPAEQHFAALEEDCDFALFEYSYIEVFMKDFPIDKRDDYINRLANVINEFHADWYKIHKDVLGHPNEYEYIAENYVGYNWKYPKVVAAGLVTLYKFYIGTPIEKIPPMVKRYLQDSGFVLQTTGVLSSNIVWRYQPQDRYSFMPNYIKNTKYSITGTQK